MGENCLQHCWQTLHHLTVHETSDHLFHKLGASFTNITHLRIVRCVLRRGLQHFITQNIHLEDAQFDKCLLDASAQSFAPCTSLRRLQVACEDNDFDEEHILSMLQLGTAAVEVLLVCSSRSFSPLVLQAIGRRFPRLTSICLDSTRLPDMSLLELFQSCKHLTHVSLPLNPAVTDATLYAIAANLKVTLLDLVENEQFTDAGLLQLAKTQTDTLEFLYLYGTSVTVSGIEAIVKNCAKLKMLSLPWNVNQSLLVLNALRYCCNLTTLAFDYKVRLGDPFLCAVALHCTRIHNLTLFVYSDAHEGVRAIMQKCICLRKVVLNTSKSPINEMTQVAWSLLCPGITFSNNIDDVLVRLF